MTVYKFIVSSKTHVIRGTIETALTDPDDIRIDVLSCAAQTAQILQYSWDPFNVEVTLVRAQSEPKLI